MASMKHTHTYIGQEGEGEKKSKLERRKQCRSERV